MIKERKHLEEKVQDLVSKMGEEEEKGKHLSKQKSKYETQIGEMEDQLNRERQVPFSVFVIFPVRLLIVASGDLRRAKSWRS